MKAIKIDAVTQTVTEVQYSGDFRDIYRIIGCQCFDVVGLENGDVCFVDDEGLYNHIDFFELPNTHQPLAGNGLIVGTDGESGESVACLSTIEDIKEQVTFLNIFEVRARFA